MCSTPALLACLYLAGGGFRRTVEGGAAKRHYELLEAVESEEAAGRAIDARSRGREEERASAVVQGTASPARRGAVHRDPEFAVGSPEWWKREKDKASAKAGRRVWAWELEAPPGHPFYVNRSAQKSWEESLRWRDPPSFPDIMSMAPIPRQEMPNWWLPTSCGTLNLTHPLARHCFPVDGSHHHVCCTNIALADEDEDAWLSPVTQLLVKSIRAASHPSSFSWCACTHAVCTELLGGTISWDQHTLTRGRYYNDQISKGFDLIGWEWLTEGMDALQELASHPLPEPRPEPEPVDKSPQAGAAANSESEAAGSAEDSGAEELSRWGVGFGLTSQTTRMRETSNEGDRSGENVAHVAGANVCSSKGCPLGSRPALRKWLAMQGQRAQQADVAAQRPAVGVEGEADALGGDGDGVLVKNTQDDSSSAARKRAALWGNESDDDDVLA